MKKETGFTLIEVIITLTLITIVLGILVSIYIFNVRTFQIELRRSKLQTETQTILDKIISDTKLATEISENYNEYSTSSDTIILAVPAVDESQNFLYAGEQFKKDYIIYYSSNNNLYKVISADPSGSRESTPSPVKLSGYTTCQFSYDPDIEDAEKINVNLTSSVYSMKRDIVVNLNSEAKLRNK